MRFVQNSLALALMGFVCAACDGLTIETARRTAADTGAVEDTGGSDADAGEDTALDTGAEDTAVDTATDTAADTTDTTDTTDTGAAVTNACGGTGLLAYRGVAAGPSDACGLCGDGELYCSGTGGLSCAGATLPNDCGGCGLVEGEIGTTCGLCGDGVWACGAGQSECVGDRPPNGCGGCTALALEPGTECALATGDAGVVVCSGRELSRCASADTNGCGGTAPLALPAGVTGVEPRPGVLYQTDCRRGVLLCDGAALVAVDLEGGNACGGCDPLLGEPGAACGACGGVWTCDAEGAVRCIGGSANACGGCAALDAGPGLDCDAGGNAGVTVCISLEETTCVPPGSTNACGGLGTITGDPIGQSCGACADGVVACDATDALRRSTVCEGASDLNGCGGCGLLDGTVGSACGTCGSGSFACSATSLVCANDAGAAAENVCGGCSTLAASPGDPCGRCGTWSCDPSATGRLACTEPAGGCGIVAVCGNGAVEAGEACDDGDANGVGSCSVGCTCSAGYHLEGGVCLSDERACSVPNGAGTETWTGSAYSACVATACASGYTLSGGACIGSLGSSCTANAECASGFCATGPDGTANDRCAPEGMNYIPAGTFTMGSPSGEVGQGTGETQHSVTLTRSFFMGQTEVTQGQWKALSGGTNPSWFQSTTDTGSSTANANDSGPVEQMDWYAAVAFANAKSTAEGLTPCYTLTGCTDAATGWQNGIHDGCTGATFGGLTCTGYRLPTESEWEYAARGGTTTATYLGNLSGGVDDCTTAQANLDGIAWWCRNSGARTNAVGIKAANSFGLYDMLGNVWEFAGDWYNATYPGTVTDPLGAGTGSSRVIRGGSWIGLARSARAADRDVAPDDRDSYVGFRLARTVPPTAACIEGTVSYLGGCSPDADADGVADVADICADFPNPDQLDLDRDGLGDLCDPDIDGDSDGNASDCADYDPDVSSLAAELCDGQDNNCNGLRDDGATGCPCATATYGSHNYLLCSTQSLSWTDAENFCVAAGYHLVTVSDAGENSWLSGGAGAAALCSNSCVYSNDFDCDDGGPGSTFSVCALGTDCGDCGPRSRFSGNFWIGYNDIASEGSFVWSSGAPAAFVSWNSGDPNNASNEDCTEFRLGGNNWNDLNCATGHPFICETDP